MNASGGRVDSKTALLRASVIGELLNAHRQRFVELCLIYDANGIPSAKRWEKGMARGMLLLTVSGNTIKCRPHPPRA